ncbi:hypothetical protein KP509_05G058500 [Ceratopteris richardii]|uniref:Uncharacterized protein n=1 Tax=Ceratopteris richardii TaxID=49495 RepID=A0A8T2UTD2_CERRI|nr:hypothetical protein KP509_05G058500 [Ceratopteris richardii]
MFNSLWIRTAYDASLPLKCSVGSSRRSISLIKHRIWQHQNNLLINEIHLNQRFLIKISSRLILIVLPKLPIDECKDIKKDSHSRYVLPTLYGSQIQPLYTNSASLTFKTFFQAHAYMLLR